jgi:hypothetical protein
MQELKTHNRPTSLPSQQQVGYDYGQIHYTVAFNVVDWDLFDFLAGQIDKTAHRVGTVVTLSGSALYAHATTCSEYMMKNWPFGALLLLDVLQNAIGSSIHHAKGMAYNHSQEHDGPQANQHQLNLRAWH